MVDRTKEIEIRLKAVRVSSEDTCVFFEKRADTQIGMRRCFFCEHYRPDSVEDDVGFCCFKNCTHYDR